MNDSDMTAYITASLQQFDESVQHLTQEWGMDQVDHWELDHSNGTITFVLSNGKSIFAPVQFIGIWSESSKVFQWAWDQIPAVPPLLQAVVRLRAFARDRSWTPFLTPEISCKEKDTWALVATAMRLNKLTGAYRCLLGNGIYAYIAFGEISES